MNPPPPNTIDVVNDQYFSLSFNETTRNWSTSANLYVTYNAAMGPATDLAGNLMPSSGSSSDSSQQLNPERYSQQPYNDVNGESGRLTAIERMRPQIRLTLGAVGGSRIYMEFTEPVFGEQDLSEELSARDFVFSDGTIAGIEVLSSGIEISSSDPDMSPIRGVTALYLEFAVPLTAEMLFDATIRGLNWNSIWDSSQNSYYPEPPPPPTEPPPLETRRITDVLIAAIEPIWAMSTPEAGSNNFTTTLREFNGTGALDDLNITIESALISTSGVHQSLPVSLHFDVNVPDSNRVSDQVGFWSAFPIPGLIEQPNNAARTARQLSDENHITQHFINASDAEIVEGVTLEFLYSIGNSTVGNRMAAWVEDPDFPLPNTLRHWSIAIRGIPEQRGGVTILNNVIDPGAGGETELRYSLERPGTVVANVFTIDGDLVKVLVRSRQGSGSYNLSWDGTNSSGNIVARGFYFIRIVGPDIDEVRKVLVVKE